MIAMASLLIDSVEHKASRHRRRESLGRHVRVEAGSSLARDAIHIPGLRNPRAGGDRHAAALLQRRLYRRRKGQTLRRPGPAAHTAATHGGQSAAAARTAKSEGARQIIAVAAKAAHAPRAVSPGRDFGIQRAGRLRDTNDRARGSGLGARLVPCSCQAP